MAPYASHGSTATEKLAPTTATPPEPPICRPVESTPEAMPVSAGDESFERLTAALRRDSEEFRSCWDTQDVAEFEPARRAFYHPGLGLLIGRIPVRSRSGTALTRLDEGT